MTLGEAIAGALPRLRAQAESRMTATVTIKRPGPPVEHPDGTVTPSWTPVYTGKARISGANQVESNPSAGGRIETVQRYRLDVPMGSCAPRVGDVVNVASSPNNPVSAGRFYRISGLDIASQTAQRMPIDDFNGDLGGWNG